jgi:hypothetical protein
MGVQDDTTFVQGGTMYDISVVMMRRHLCALIYSTILYMTFLWVHFYVVVVCIMHIERFPTSPEILAAAEWEYKLVVLYLVPIRLQCPSPSPHNDTVRSRRRTSSGVDSKPVKSFVLPHSKRISIFLCLRPLVICVP